MIHGTGGTTAAGAFASLPGTDTTGTPGNAVVATRQGRSSIAAGQQAVTITLATMSGSSQVFATLLGNAPAGSADATLTSIPRCFVPAAGGGFTIIGNAVATADTRVMWLVVG